MDLHVSYDRLARKRDSYPLLKVKDGLVSTRQWAGTDICLEKATQIYIFSPRHSHRKLFSKFLALPTPNSQVFSKI